MLDLIVIGLGPAGITAGIYAKRSNLNVLCLEQNIPGGLMNATNVVDNYPGFNSITGPELSIKMFEHFKKMDIPYKKEEVKNIIDHDNYKEVVTNKNNYNTKAIIICGGRSYKRIGLPNEEKLQGHGLSNCAICDAPLFKNKIVAIYGAGNSAYEEGIYLANYAKKIYMISRSAYQKADDLLEEKMKKFNNIEYITEVEIIELLEQNDNLSGLKLSNSTTLKVDGLFTYIGLKPKTDFISKLNITNEMGYIEVNKKNETKIPGIYAAGDIINKQVYQIVSATSDGAIAAVNAYNYIKS